MGDELDHDVHAPVSATCPGVGKTGRSKNPVGESVRLEFHETAAAWRAHPEHREAQRLGRERWLAEYRITVCDVARDYSFKA